MFVCQTCYAEYREARERCVRDATLLLPLIDEPLRGHIIERKYRLEKRLGAGGMSVVYLATRLAIGDQAAIKILNRNLISDEQGYRRFEQEARLAASVKHPNVVAIYDFGTTEHQTAFLVMEYLDGPTLAQELRRSGGLSLERALEIFQPVCAAVDAAHKEGLIHRDIKPNNIILQQLKRGDEFIKVVDFGIAKLLDDPTRLNQHLSGSNVFGTLGYMPYEQLTGIPLDARTDIYGLAVTLYQTLTARMPYAANTIVDLYRHMVEGRLRPLRERRPDISPSVEQVIAQALATNREQRPATPREFWQMLYHAASVAPVPRLSDTSATTRRKAISDQPDENSKNLFVAESESDNAEEIKIDSSYDQSRKFERTIAYYGEGFETDGNQEKVEVESGGNRERMESDDNHESAVSDRVGSSSERNTITSKTSGTGAGNALVVNELPNVVDSGGTNQQIESTHQVVESTDWADFDAIVGANETSAMVKPSYTDTIQIDPATLRLEMSSVPVPESPLSARELPLSARELSVPIIKLNFDQFVAREAELLALQQHYQRAIEGRASALIIVGEPGVGKSQLLAAYRKSLETNCVITRTTRFCDYGEAREPYQRFFELLGGIPLELAVNSNMEFNLQLDKWQIFEAIKQHIQELARTAPLVILLEDLHWADSLSLELLGYIMRNCIDTPLQLIASAREEEADTAGCLLREWLIEQSRYRSYELIHLSAFTIPQMRVLLETIFGNLQIAEPELERLHNETAGNPYFLCEVLRFLIDNGDLSAGEQGGWRLTAIDQFELPASIINLVSLKLRRFSPAELDLFTQAAIIGDEFSFETLQLMSGVDETELEAILNKGVREWVLKEQLTTRDADYRFYHTTISRVLYNSIARRYRVKMHACAASALEQVFRANRARIAGRLAYHHFQALNWQSAFDYGVIAGDAAYAQQAIQPAAQYYQWASEAREQLRVDHQSINAINSIDAINSINSIDLTREFRLRINYAHTLLVLGRISDAQLEVDAATSLNEQQLSKPLADDQANQLNHANNQAWASFMQSRVAQFRGDFQQSLTACLAGLKALAEVNGESSEINRRLLHQQGYTYFMLGKLSESQLALARCVEFAQADGDIKMAGGASSLLGLVLANIGSRSEGLVIAQNAIEMLRRSNDRMGELIACERLGIINDLLGQYQAALEWYREGLVLAKTLAHRKQELTLLINIGENYRLQGSYEQAEQNYRQGLALAQELDHRDVQSTAIYNLGLVSLARNNYQEAARQLGQALTMLCAQGRQHPEAEVLCELGNARIGLGEWHDALDLFRASLSLCQKIFYPDYEWRAHAGMARCYFQLGDYKRAKTSFQTAIGLIERLRDQLAPDVDRDIFMRDKQEVYQQFEALIAQLDAGSKKPAAEE